MSFGWGFQCRQIRHRVATVPIEGRSTLVEQSVGLVKLRVLSRSLLLRAEDAISSNTDSTYSVWLPLRTAEWWIGPYVGRKTA